MRNGEAGACERAVMDVTLVAFGAEESGFIRVAQTGSPLGVRDRRLTRRSIGSIRLTQLILGDDRARRGHQTHAAGGRRATIPLRRHS